MAEVLKKRGRKLDPTLPPSRSRDVQRAFRARRAAYMTNLERRNAWLEVEVRAMREALRIPEGQYATGPPPVEVEPDYAGTGSRRRKSAAIDTKAWGSVNDDDEGPRRDGDGDGDDGDGEGEGDAAMQGGWVAMFAGAEGPVVEVARPRRDATGDSVEGGRCPPPSTTVSSSSHRARGQPRRRATGSPSTTGTTTSWDSNSTTRDVNRSSNELATPPAPGRSSQPPDVQYGVYFVPKGQDSVTFVGTTPYNPFAFAPSSDLPTSTSTSSSCLTQSPVSYYASAPDTFALPLPPSVSLPLPLPLPNPFPMSKPFPSPSYTTASLSSSCSTASVASCSTLPTPNRTGSFASDYDLSTSIA
ncbi:hypothetical protein JCM10212_000300 [Sporobolomyces blumeae]